MFRSHLELLNVDLLAGLVVQGAAQISALLRPPGAGAETGGAIPARPELGWSVP